MDTTRDIITSELQVALAELREQLLYTSLEKIFIEERIYKCHGACLDSGKASYGRMPRECFAVFVFEFGVTVARTNA